MKGKSKKLFLLSLIVLTIYNFSIFGFAIEGEDLELTGEAALLIDEDFDAILFGKNIHEKLYPASTTKIMTAILAIENFDLSDVCKVDQEIVSLTKGSHVALDYDEEMTVDNLLHALLIASANDAALTLAKHYSGNIDDFVNLMNEKAKEIGANDTHFANPHGLHDENHYTTAYDLYLITKYAMENDKFKEIITMPRFVVPATNKKEERYILNTNRFLVNNGKMNINGDLKPISYDGICGVKTGFTDEAGNCLVSYANKNGKGMYTVVLKSEKYDVYADTYKLMEYGYNNFSTRNIASKNEFVDNLNLDNATIPFISTVVDKDIYYPIKNDKLPEIKKDINFNEDIKAPIKKGDILGRVDYYIDNENIGSANIISTISADAVNGSIISFIKSKWYLFVIFFLVLVRVIETTNRIKRRNKRMSRRNNSDMSFVNKM